jgi:hypothetical protein
MRNGAFVFVALLLGGCGSHTTSLDDARSRYLDTMKDYQACLNAPSGEAVKNCEPKQVVAAAAERAYKDAMSNGLGSSSR